MLTRVAGRGGGNTETLAWRFGLVGALLVNLKHANPVLLAWSPPGLRSSHGAIRRSQSRELWPSFPTCWAQRSSPDKAQSTGGSLRDCATSMTERTEP
jgi:hypothetical protein